MQIKPLQQIIPLTAYFLLCLALLEGAHAQQAGKPSLSETRIRLPLQGKTLLEALKLIEPATPYRFCR